MKAEERSEVLGLVYEELGRRCQKRACPTCGVDTLFILFDIPSEDKLTHRLRCLNCLSLFEEKLRPVPPHKGELSFNEPPPDSEPLSIQVTSSQTIGPGCPTGAYTEPCPGVGDGR